MATNDNATILVPVKRNSKGGIDEAAILEEAKKIVHQYAEDDKAATKAVIDATDQILSNKKWEKVTTITAGTLAKMALSMMQELPTEKLCQETEARVKAYLQGQPDKFLFIARGRNAGFHFRSRLTRDALAKLEKEATANEAKRDSEAAE